MKAALLSWRFPSAWSGRDTQTETQGSTSEFHLLLKPSHNAAQWCEVFDEDWVNLTIQ